MSFDLATLKPLAGTLERIGLPALGTILGVVLPPPFDLMVGPAFTAISTAMGISPTAPTAPGDLQSAIEADPAAAATKLQTLEQAHRDAADAANEELRIRTADVQDARATEVKLTAANSPMQWGPAVISFIIILGYAVCCVVALPGAAVQAGMYETIKLLAVTVASYWLGSSTGSRAKDDHLAALARSPTVQAQPGSHVSAAQIKGGR